jgi:hypothetical protein
MFSILYIICNKFGIDLGQILKIDLNTDFYKLLFMAILKIEVLKKIIENIPDNYDVEFHNGTTNVPLSDTVEIDVSGERILFKS